MKICFLLKEYPCISQTFVSNQINELRGAGNVIDIYSYKEGYSKNQSDNKVRYFKTKPGYYSFIILTVQCLLKIFFSLNWALLKECFQLICEKNYRTLIDLFILYKHRAMFKDEKYDVALTHFGMNAYLLEAGKRFGFIDAKIIGGIYHGFDMSVTQLLEVNLPAYKRSFKGLDLILPISQLWKDKLISWGVHPDKLHIIRMGINIEEFSFHPKVIDFKRKVKILTVGRFVEKKGTEYLIRAMQKIDGAELNIIGDGIKSEQYKELVDTLALTNKVFFKGEMSSTEIYQHLRDSDVFCLPSVTAKNGDMEGIPVALMEAMASGTLVISTYHSGIPELIIDKQTGMLCEEKNIDDIVIALKSLPALDLDNMLINARRHIELEFDNKKITISLIKILHLHLSRCSSIV